MNSFISIKKATLFYGHWLYIEINSFFTGFTRITNNEKITANQ